MTEQPHQVRFPGVSNSAGSRLDQGLPHEIETTQIEETAE
jgi:hypothetical protein